MILTIIAIIVCYLIGSISPGIIITKFQGKGDIRSYGSGGTGATNVNRTLGTKFGLLVLLFDCLKAVIPILILKFYIFQGDPMPVYYCSLAVLLGHIFPIYYKFKGGKGVSTVLGILLCTNWLLTLIALAIFVLVVLISRYVSLGSIIAVISFALLTLTKSDHDLFSFSAIVALIVVYTHKANIGRLIDGKENRFSFKKAK